MLGSNTNTFDPRSGVAARAAPPKTSATTTIAEAAATVLQRCLAIPSSFLRGPSGTSILRLPASIQSRLEPLEALGRPDFRQVVERLEGRRRLRQRHPGGLRARVDV